MLSEKDRAHLAASEAFREYIRVSQFGKASIKLPSLLRWIELDRAYRSLP
jgi:hypothetical protein